MYDNGQHWNYDDRNIFSVAVDARRQRACSPDSFFSGSHGGDTYLCVKT